MEKAVSKLGSDIKDMGKLPIETVEKLLKNLQQSTISDFLHLVTPNIRKELNRAKIRQSASNSNSNPSPNKKEKTQQDQFVEFQTYYQELKRSAEEVRLNFKDTTVYGGWRDDLTDISDSSSEEEVLKTLGKAKVAECTSKMNTFETSLAVGGVYEKIFRWYKHNRRTIGISTWEDYITQKTDHSNAFRKMSVVGIRRYRACYQVVEIYPRFKHAQTTITVFSKYCHQILQFLKSDTVECNFWSQMRDKKDEKIQSFGFTVVSPDTNTPYGQNVVKTSTYTNFQEETQKKIEMFLDIQNDMIRERKETELKHAGLEDLDSFSDMLSDKLSGMLLEDD